MAPAMKIGELAKQTGLSVRTLHYYDEIGLLSPSRRTDSEHRLYERQDIVRLQQILSLRQLGLSLKEIRDCLEQPNYSLSRTIDLHRSKLREQLSLSQKLLNRLDLIANELASDQAVTVENLIQTIEAITMTTQYFTPKQQKVLDVRLRLGEAEWQDILQQIRAEMNTGTDLISPRVRTLARRWLWHLNQLVQGDRDIYESLMQMYQNEGAIAAWGMDSDLFAYILRAIFSMAIADFTDTAIPRQDIFTAATLEVIRLGEIPIRAINFLVFGTEALLLGILAENNSTAAQVLADAGVQYKTVHPIVVRVLGTRPELKVEAPKQLPFAPRVDLVIELALEEAAQQGQTRQIAPEHLMLGILKEYQTSPPPGGVATYVLKEELGVDLDMLEQQLRAAIKE